MSTPSQRLKLHRNKDYLAWIRTQPCEACAVRGNIQAAHVRKGNGGGMGIKPSDYRTVPLCHACHLRQHQEGEESFWQYAYQLHTDGVIFQLLLDYIMATGVPLPQIAGLPVRDRIELMENALEAARNA